MKRLHSTMMLRGNLSGAQSTSIGSVVWSVESYNASMVALHWGHTLCVWLVQNTSREHPSLLPERILRCHGWKIPSYVRDWDVRQGTFIISNDTKGNHFEKNDRSLQLEIETLSRVAAIRLSVIPLYEKTLDPEPKLTVDDTVESPSEK